MKIINTERLQLITLINFAAKLGFIYDNSTKTFIGYKNRVTFNKMVAFFNNPAGFLTSIMYFNELAAKVNKMHGVDYLDQNEGVSVINVAFKEAPIERVALVYSKKKGKINCNSQIVKLKNRMSAYKYMRLLNLPREVFVKKGE